MIKKIGIIGLTILILVSIIMTVPQIRGDPPIPLGGVIFVDPSGGGDYRTIQEAIDNAEPGDTIKVKSGTYYEQVSVPKQLYLIGEDKDSTFIDGGSNPGSVVTITDDGDGVEISEFTIMNSGNEPGNAGISIDSSNNVVIYGNIITLNNGGIYCSKNVDTTIEENTVKNSLHYGISLASSDDNNIQNNIIAGNGNGMILGSCSNNLIVGNIFALNDVGIFTSGVVLGNSIKKNNFEDNEIGIQFFNKANNNQIYHNNFKNSDHQAVDGGRDNVWHDGYPNGGNYWSDYDGSDKFNGPKQDENGPDGIGDIPYRMSPTPAATGQDQYPYMASNGWTVSNPLDISAPSEVMGGQSFEVKITSQGEPVENANVFHSQIIKLTDSDGVATLTAPQTPERTSIEIYAEKTGYKSDQQFITILPPSPEQLNIISDPGVGEGVQFTITVTTYDHPVGVEGAVVEFNGETKLTNIDGEVTFTSPEVSKDTEYTITASHPDYPEGGDEKTIMVIDLDQDGAKIYITSPYGGEIWQGTQEITWITIPADDPLVYHTVTIQYQHAEEEPKTIAVLEDINSPYKWDTTTVADGVSYTIKVILKKDNDGIVEIVSEDASDYFAINNNPSNEGQIGGFVTDHDKRFLIDSAMVCVGEVNTNEASSSRKCTVTVSGGYELIGLPYGTYTITVSQIGYEAYEGEVTLTTGYHRYDISLKKAPSDPSSDKNTELINNAVNLAAKSGYVGAKINFNKDRRTTVDLYSDKITINPKEPTSDGFSFTVSAEPDTEGTLFVVSIAGPDPKTEFKVLLNGDKIKKEMSISEFLNPQTLADDSYLLFLPEDGDDSIVCVYISEFSEHEISIIPVQEIVETISVIAAVALYITVLVVLAITTAIPVMRLWKKIE